MVSTVRSPSPDSLVWIWKIAQLPLPRNRLASSPEPVVHQFKYAIYFAYLDLDELPGLLSSVRLMSASRWAPAAFCRADHLGPATEPLTQSVRRLVRHQTGLTIDGPIRLLTLLRSYGYYFSPLNLYFCFDDDVNVNAIVAEVSNTPWLEKHYYCLWAGNRLAEGERQRFRHPKEFHVSPFMPMDAEYEWHVSRPGAELKVHLASHGGAKPFAATLQLRRQPLTSAQLVRSLLRFPLMTAQVIAAIHYEALRLWLKKCPFYPHPNASERKSPKKLLRRPTPTR